MDLSSPTSPLIRHLLTASTMRAKVIAGNVANQNTPGYQRREVVFEDELAQAIRGGASIDELVELDPMITVDKDAKARADGNSVDMEAEVSAARENRILYELYANISRGQSRLTEIAIRSQG